ncbi:glycerophosphodiester phosphodiesterase [Simiduia curdlanivorans]|uniref:Glycerophosphodiester phosphodiesterase n=1 Tax=Simiduia curdlanivorans TaxID=1492769 RepID=A0ABV8V3D9_9GAMM|nr:glycerophosphodiester phosphodiesterase [Simiduia curdlanivorans]MDN3640201.1 glycerophosphodiester phosphodiesterase [Simiduia curdlanivorans]
MGIMKKIALVLVALLAVYAGLRFFVSAAPTHHPFYQDVGFEVIAHGAGQGLQPKNTLEAALLSHKLAADVIEIDIHASSDGVLVLSHDETVDDMTDGTGFIKDKTFEELQSLDAALGFKKLSGSPLQGTGVKIPALQDVFTALPGARYIIEIKQLSPSIAESLCELIQQRNMQGQVLVGSFFTEPLETFRQHCPSVATSMSQEEVTKLVILQKMGLSHLYDLPGVALQVPMRSGAITVVTESFLRDMKQRGVRVQIWTVNSLDEMRELIEMGVDGIITDYPDRLHTLISNTTD